MDTEKIKPVFSFNHTRFIRVQFQSKTAQHLLHLLFNLLSVTPQQDNEIIRIPDQCSADSRHLEHFVERMQVYITQQR